METQIFIWIAFNIFVIGMLIIDLKVFHRQAHKIQIKEALIWSGIWIALALVFNVGIYFWRGSETALEYLTGYLIEKSLSMDNLFVFLLIFAYFGVAPRYQHDVLFWGILGALIMRGIFIAAGITLIERFHWVIYVFGAFLIYTGIRLAFQKDQDVDPEKNPALKLLRRFVPITERYEGTKFFVKRAGRIMATPLFVVLIVIETTDVIFAVDSVPAVLAITRDPFIVYTSNVFAILGLRALYFALAGIMRMFHYLHYGLSIILAFVGLKMVLSDIVYLPASVALGMVGGILTISIIASIIWPPQEESHTISASEKMEPEQAR
jgi:tellurite resistance protein TerC